jgi:hypothetical protein
MEALLEREEQVENWNDDRMDELSRRMDAGFEKAATKVELTGVKGEVAGLRREVAGVNEEMNRRFNEGGAQLERFESHVRTEFHRFTDRLDKLFYLQLAFMTSLAVGLLTDAI